MALSTSRTRRVAATRRREVDVLFLSELYWPEETSTGHIVTGLAEGIAADRSVTVVAAQPTYSQRGKRGASREVRNNVEIVRVWSTRFAKDSMAGRLVNYVSVSAAIFVKALALGWQAESIVSVTNPPILPYVGASVARVVGAQHIVMVHDGYPDIPIAAGLLSRDGLPARVLARLVRTMYRSAAVVVVLGTDMAERIAELAGDATTQTRTRVVRNWADADSVKPLPREESSILAELGISDRFVIQFAGNIGRLQDVPSLLRSMESLKARDDIHLLIVGTGSERPTVERWIASGRLPNVTLIDPLPRDGAVSVHQACDAALVSLVPGMLGVSVPSRSYNFMAAGRPIIAMVHSDSEIGRVVDSSGIGWRCDPGDWRALADTIEFVADHPDEAAEKGVRARQLAEQTYTLDVSVAALAEALDSANVRDS